jgi:hypothetical protein
MRDFSVTKVIRGVVIGLPLVMLLALASSLRLFNPDPASRLPADLQFPSDSIAVTPEVD